MHCVFFFCSLIIKNFAGNTLIKFSFNKKSKKIKIEKMNNQIIITILTISNIINAYELDYYPPCTVNIVDTDKVRFDRAYIVHMQKNIVHMPRSNARIY